jgi:hypothetical protein
VVQNSTRGGIVETKVAVKRVIYVKSSVCLGTISILRFGTFCAVEARVANESVLARSEAERRLAPTLLSRAEWGNLAVQSLSEKVQIIREVQASRRVTLPHTSREPRSQDTRLRRKRSTTVSRLPYVAVPL